MASGMHRAGRRSPSPRGCPRSRYAREEHPHDAHELPLPGAHAPSCTLQPQAVASRHCFAAGACGTLLSISGGSLFESSAESHQQIQVGPRPRPLTCIAGSPCGKWLAIGESCFGGRSGQVIIISGESKEVAAVMTLGVRRSARHLCWAAQGELVAAIVEFESEHTMTAEQQLMVWSWPSGERLATSTCGRGTQDMAGAPDGAVFLTVGAFGAKVWTLVRSHDSIASRAAGGVKISCGGGFLPLRLLGRSLPIGPVGPAALAACNRNLAGTASAGRRRPAEDALIAVAFGPSSSDILPVETTMIVVAKSFDPYFTCGSIVVQHAFLLGSVEVECCGLLRVIRHSCVPSDFALPSMKTDVRTEVWRAHSSSRRSMAALASPSANPQARRSLTLANVASAALCCP